MTKTTNNELKETTVWNVVFYVLNPLPFLPRAMSISHSCTNTAIYVNRGIDRKKEYGYSVFQYTLSGCGRIRIGDTVHDLPAEKAFLCNVANPDIDYFYHENATIPWYFVFFVFHNAHLLVEEINRKSGHLFNIGKDTALITDLMNYGKFNSSAVELKAGESSLLVQRFLSQLIDLSQPSVEEDNVRMKLIRKAHRLINSNINCPYNSSMLAEDLGVSHAHLIRTFKNELETTPFKVLTSIKMKQACTLLKGSDLSCREIALRLGYDPGSHFARSFKNFVGMTPLTFRKKGVVQALSQRG